MFAIAERNLLITAAAFLMVSALPADAATLVDGNFSTQTPPYETATGNAWSVGGPGLTELAVGFQDPSGAISYLLNNIQVADNFSISDPNASGNASLNDLTVGLWQAATDDPNTATLLQFWTVAPLGAPGAPGTAFTLNSVTPTVIAPGLFYFITETTPNDGANTAEWGWQENNLTPMQIGFFSGINGTPGSYSFQNTGCTVDPCTATNDPDASGTPAFLVSGDAVMNTPEPATGGLLAAAGAFAALAGRKRLMRATSRR